MTGEITDNNDVQMLLNHNKPGSALRALRESKGIALEQITEQSLIPLRKLEDLEQDKYDELGGATFVNGYVRKYAKLLDVDSDAFVEALSCNLETASGISLTSATETSIAAGVESGAKSSGLKLINRVPGPAAVAVLLLLWGGVVFFMGDDQQASHDPVPSEGQQPASAENLESPDVAPLDERPAVAVESPTVTPEPAPLPAFEATPVPTAEPTPVALPGSVAEAADPSEAGEDLLIMSFSDDCWVEVTDATGNVVFAQLKSKGDNLQLFGEAPFEVMLGNARAAEMLINGNPVAINPVPNRKTLRFTVTP